MGILHKSWCYFMTFTRRFDPHQTQNELSAQSYTASRVQRILIRVKPPRPTIIKGRDSYRKSPGIPIPYKGMGMKGRSNKGDSILNTDQQKNQGTVSQ